MFKSSESTIKSLLRSPPKIENNCRSVREVRDSESSDYRDDVSSRFSKINPSANRVKNNTNELNVSNRLSRRSSNQKRSTDKLFNVTNVQKMVTQLKQEYAQEARLSRYSNLIKAKSEHNFQPLCPIKPQQEQKGKNVIEEVQEKLSQYNNSRLVSAKSESRFLEMVKSPQKSNKLSEKTERCRQLCLQIKRKLFKETVSTTTTESSKKVISISDFRLEKLIGEGKFSKVYIARHKKAGIILAVKVIKKQTIKKENFLEQLIRQVKIQSFLNHVNIVKLYAVFHDRLNVYLLLEYCEGAQLYDIFKVKSKLREEEWQPIMKGICEGLYELHRFSVIHRDLKPENIVLSFGLPKIGDFGWSVYNTMDKRETFCGTPLYISPELLLGNSYDKQVDIWALGVMMYEFLTGRIPFKIQHQKNLLQIVNSNIVYPKFLSEECIRLLKMILEKDPGSRIGILDILEHAFLTKQAQSSGNAYNLFKFSR